MAFDPKSYKAPKERTNTLADVAKQHGYKVTYHAAQVGHSVVSLTPIGGDIEESKYFSNKSSRVIAEEMGWITQDA